ncbi:DNA polymerase III subunit epsilon [Enterovirga aerilata]|uniref:DNA polymerase III subunit epsilon n=1 Tax=Enterovirga aerilata TaxID=2730920 RepID=A0A849IBQ2_9HYPH|nr:DNA polymerase III subunit epsilon [Enterovirga sp. DB1703]NNM73685.1 DNA polymerase III subunit epsilon [Enterovirga sp. DB1703]
MREIVFDTETTGTEHLGGDRVVEIGCVELLNHIPTGRVFHRYINPERPCHPEAFRVHGLSDEFLAGHPVFAALADEICDFFGDAKLIAHNAAFDIAFLNVEFGRTGHPTIVMDRVVDSLALARRKHPGASNSLDALCQRYGIDNSRRTKHGALLDAELLAEVYVELIGGKQADLGLAVGPAPRILVQGATLDRRNERTARPVRPPLDEATVAAHLAFIDSFGATPIWRDYVAEAMPDANAA